MVNENAYAGRAYDFTPGDFDRVCRLIREHAGIQLLDGKQDMVYGRIARRIRAKRLNSFAEYLLQIESDPDEWEAFVNSLTTNLTSFFRESYHFPILADYLREHRGRKIKLWCSAASTGEEPYSMAITAIQALGANPAVEIVATDIDTKVLAEGQAGIYPYERVKNLPADHLACFLRGSGRNAGKVKVRPEVRSLVRFSQMNLLNQRWEVGGPFDVIFCRNVLIYFDRRTQRQVVERFAPLLNPGGLLFIGHSESLAHDRDLFRLRGQTVYERSHHPGARMAHGG